MTTQAPKKPIIQALAVKKSFPTASGDVEILHDANFEVPDGSFTIIYGASGSGKSTLLNLIMGLSAPTQGRMLFDGQDVYSLGGKALADFRANTMGMVQQTNYWVKSLSVVENVAIPLYFQGIDKDKAEAQAIDSLKRVSMDQHAKKHPTVLSGGEQQKVAMARALVNNPTFIVADEPTGSLDSKNGDMIMDWLRYFHRELNRTIILVTHNMEYLPIANKLLFIEDGVVKESVGKSIHDVTDALMVDMKKRITSWSKADERPLV